jgi:hypothetical protein
VSAIFAARMAAAATLAAAVALISATMEDLFAFMNSISEAVGLPFPARSPAELTLKPYLLIICVVVISFSSYFISYTYIIASTWTIVNNYFMILQSIFGQ